MNQKLKDAIMDRKKSMQVPFWVYTETGETAYIEDINDGDTVYCVYRMPNGKVGLFWGNVHIMLHGEKAVMLSEHDSDVGLGSFRLFVSFYHKHSSYAWGATLYESSGGKILV